MRPWRQPYDPRLDRCEDCGRYPCVCDRPDITLCVCGVDARGHTPGTDHEFRSAFQAASDVLGTVARGALR